MTRDLCFRAPLRASKDFAMLRTLYNRQTRETLRQAVDRHVPATLTFRQENHWATLHSRVLAMTETCLLLELPAPEAGVVLPRPRVGDDLGVSFKLKHYKHMFASPVRSIEQMNYEGVQIEAVYAACPGSLQRLQRRAYNRVNVPEGRIVRAAFWLGSKEDEPSGTSPENPVWSGRIVDLSAGGFQARIEGDASSSLEEGALVGVRLAFGPARETVYVDAQFRHVQIEGENAIMGFQFVGLAYGPEGRHAIDLIAAKVAEFQSLTGQEAS